MALAGQIPNSDRTMGVALSSALPSFSIQGGSASLNRMPAPVDSDSTQHLNLPGLVPSLLLPSKDRGQPRSLGCVLSHSPPHWFDRPTSCIICHSLTVHTRFQILSPQQRFLLWKAKRLLSLSHNKKSHRVRILRRTQAQSVVKNGCVLGCEDSTHERVQRLAEREMGEHRGR